MFSVKLEFASVSDFRDNSSFGLNILGPLCLWQCLKVITLVNAYILFLVNSKMTLIPNPCHKELFPQNFIQNMFPLGEICSLPF